LTIANRSDVDIGVGIPTESFTQERQREWIKDYDLTQYKGKLYQNGVERLVELIMASKEKITLICIGPLVNISTALQKQPEIKDKVRFVGMQGCIRKGYYGRSMVTPEYNVLVAPRAAQMVFQSFTDMTITPLDTCGTFRLEGGKYKRIKDGGGDALVKAILENYYCWAQTKKDQLQPNQVEIMSSILFDVVAVYLAYSTSHIKMEKLELLVTLDGYTKIDAKNGKEVNCATEWINMGAVINHVVERLVHQPKL